MYIVRQLYLEQKQLARGNRYMLRVQCERNATGISKILPNVIEMLSFLKGNDLSRNKELRRNEDISKYGSY